MRVGHVLISAVTVLGVVAGSLADECDPNDPTLLKPDLVAEPPSHVHVVEHFGHRFVFFSTTVGNVGQGPLILEGKTVDDPNNPTGPQVTEADQIINRTDGTTCTHLAGYFTFHPEHHHWHFDDFADYQVRKGDVEHTDDPLTGEVVAQAEKVSFCLIDVKKLHGYHTPITIASNCLVQDGIQGIDVGYADVYDSVLPGQFIDLDADPTHPLPGGNYFLVNTANPRGAILEVNDSLEANSGVVSISVPPPPGQRRSPRTVRTVNAPRPPLPLPSSHQTPNTPGQPHTTVPSFPQPSRPSHPLHPAHRSAPLHPAHPAPPLHPSHPTS
jgi:hypothetical protein